MEDKEFLKPISKQIMDQIGDIDKMNKMDNYTVKDSGDRREFASGAVRDMQVGKGRCDLLPLAELSVLITNMDIEKDYMQTIISFDDHPEFWIFRHFNNAINALNAAKNSNDKEIEKISYEIIDSLYMALEIFLVRFYKYPEGTNRKINFWSTLHDVFNSIPADNEEAIKYHINAVLYSAILDLAKHFEAGASKYGDNNWRKGIPINVFIDSAVRHFCKFMRGDTDEPHDIAFMWNVVCCIWTINNLGLIIQEEQK